MENWLGNGATKSILNHKVMHTNEKVYSSNRRLLEARGSPTEIPGEVELAISVGHCCYGRYDLDRECREKGSEQVKQPNLNCLKGTGCKWKNKMEASQ